MKYKQIDILLNQDKGEDEDIWNENGRWICCRSCVHSFNSLDKSLSEYFYCKQNNEHYLKNYNLFWCVCSCCHYKNRFNK